MSRVFYAAAIVLWALAGPVSCARLMERTGAVNGDTGDETPQLDASVDSDMSPLRDGPLDSRVDTQRDGPLDSRVDTHSNVDASPPPRETGVPEQGVVLSDQGTTNPACPSDANLVFSYSATMKVCQGTTAVAQCNIAARCGAGWTPCTPAQFFARGGTTIASPSGLFAWLAGCIDRKGSKVLPPAPGACPCTVANLSPQLISWPCGTGSASATTISPMGITSSSTCRRLGSNDIAYAAFWATKVPSLTLDAVVCCN